MDFIIKKLGWENAADLHRSAKNIYEDYIAGNLQAVVVSAIRTSDFNTTDKLIQLGKLLTKEDIDRELVITYIKKLRQFHLDILEEKLLCSKEKLIQVVIDKFDYFLESISYFIKNRNKTELPSYKNDYSIDLEKWGKLSLIWFWEVISSEIFSNVIDSISVEGICSKSVDLSNIVNREELERKTDTQVFDLLSQKISKIILERIEWWHIPVLSGYMGSFKGGIEKNIGRGYSDATAAVCTVGLARRWYGVVLEIQKSVEWFLSADPRILENPENTQLIPELDYLIAREITGDCGAQARLLHPQALRSEVQEAGVKIHLYNPFSWWEGSWILDKQICKTKSHDCRWVSFIGGRRKVIFCSISSWKMFERGMLATLFGIVKKYFSVDIVSASETEVTFTFDALNLDLIKLRKMTQKLKQAFHLEVNTCTEFIEYKKDKALLFCVGEHMKNHIWLLGSLAYCLAQNNINVDMVSQWILQRAIVFWIDEKDFKKAINVLHNEFIKWKK